MKFVVDSFDVIPTGIYDAKLVALEEVASKQPSKFEHGRDTYYQWTFEIAGKTRNIEMRATSSPSFGTRTKGYGWACALIGRQLVARETGDTDDFIGKQCRLSVRKEEGENGMDRNAVVDVLPMRKQEEEPF